MNCAGGGMDGEYTCTKCEGTGIVDWQIEPLLELFLKFVRQKQREATDRLKQENERLKEQLAHLIDILEFGTISIPADPFGERKPMYAQAKQLLKEDTKDYLEGRTIEGNPARQRVADRFSRLLNLPEEKQMTIEEQCLEWLNSDWQDEIDLRDFVAKLLSARDQQWREAVEGINCDCDNATTENGHVVWLRARDELNRQKAKLLEEMNND
jgi:hypothetical protein